MSRIFPGSVSMKIACMQICTKMSFLILQNINIPVSVHYLNVTSLLGCFVPSLLLTVGQMLTEIVIDRMHFKGRKDSRCRETCDPSKFEELKKVRLNIVTYSY